MNMENGLHRTKSGEYVIIENNKIVEEVYLKSTPIRSGLHKDDVPKIFFDVEYVKNIYENNADLKIFSIGCITNNNKEFYAEIIYPNDEIVRPCPEDQEISKYYEDTALNIGEKLDQWIIELEHNDRTEFWGWQISFKWNSLIRQILRDQQTDAYSTFTYPIDMYSIYRCQKFDFEILQPTHVKIKRSLHMAKLIKSAYEKTFK
jgi:hypothetical protein